MALLNADPLATNFMRYLLSVEVQSYLASEAYEIPLVNGIKQPDGLPKLTSISPPKIDLTQLADLRPTIDLTKLPTSSPSTCQGSIAQRNSIRTSSILTLP